MGKKPNYGQYFSGSRFMRLPLYKLAAGGTAVLLCAGLGLSVMAAAFNGPDTPSKPAPTPTPAPAATAAPTATPAPSATPTPVIDVQAEITVVQQDIGVQLYSVSATGEDAENDGDGGKQPLTGVAMTVRMTDAAGAVNEYPVDTESGTALAEEVAPGDYTIALPETEGYRCPEPQTVTVREKVVYKADTAAVKEKIVQAADVVESQEDTGSSAAPIANEVTDTVPFAEPGKTETGKRVTYTPQLSADGYLLMNDGTVSPYRPVYDETTKALKGATRGTLTAAPAGGVTDNAPAADANGALTASFVPNRANTAITYLGKAAPRAAQLRRTAVTDPAVEGATGAGLTDGGFTDTDPGVESAAPTPAPATNPAVPTAAPTPDAGAVVEPDSATPAPTPAGAAATAAPSQVPATPTAAPDAAAPGADPTAGLPEQIEAGQLAGYGFAVAVSEEPTYEYTGWQEINGSNYYYNPDNHQPVTGTQVIQGTLYTFGADGALNQTARGVDVSKFQGDIDWNAVAADGVTFAIIRCGYRGYGSGALVEDAAFRANIQGATAAGLKVGVYFYSQAVNEEEAVEEASMVLSLCAGYGLPCGVYYDTEKVGGDSGRADGISAAERTACAVAFCETIRNAGYTAGVYSYASWFYNGLNFANLSKYRIWIAQYKDSLDFSYHYNIWQYTSTGKVNGIPKAVDMNIG